MIVLLLTLGNPLVPTAFEVGTRMVAAIFIVALIVATAIWIRLFLRRNRDGRSEQVCFGQAPLESRPLGWGCDREDPA